MRVFLVAIVIAGAAYSNVNGRDFEWRSVQLPAFLSRCLEIAYQEAYRSLRVQTSLLSFRHANRKAKVIL